MALAPISHGNNGRAKSFTVVASFEPQGAADRSAPMRPEASSY